MTRRPSARQTGDPLDPKVIKEVRARLGLSQDEFAARLGLRGGKSVISGWENGHTKCEGPAAELILLLFGTDASPELSRIVASADAIWRRAGNYLPAWRQIAIVPLAPFKIAPDVFASLFPGTEIPPDQHAHGFPAIEGLPSGVYGLGTQGWTGAIPVERERPPQYHWSLGRGAAFLYRERPWEEDAMAFASGHTHFGSLLDIAMNGTFFYQRLAERCGLPASTQCRVQLDLEGIAGRGVVAYRTHGRSDTSVDDPKELFAENHLAVSVTKHVQEFLNDPLHVGYALVAEAALVLRPDLASAASLEDQLRRRHHQDDSDSKIRLLGFLDPIFGRRHRRRGIVSLAGTRVGVLEETYQGSRFTYDIVYLQRHDAIAVSPTMPLGGISFESKGLHPFFANLLPEGGRLDTVSQRLRIDRNDRFGLLLATGADGIGAVEVRWDGVPP